MERLIKKYKNRRLYDTETSRYITIEELQQYALTGLLFRVEEAATGKDLTNTTLLQIMVDIEAEATSFFSTNMLRQLILLIHHPLNQSFKKNLEQFFNAMEKNSSFTSNPEATKIWEAQMEHWLEQWHKFF